MRGDVEWIHLAQNMQQWLFLLNTVMNGQVSYNVGTILTR